MKTFTATDARNKFGEFLDVGVVEGVKLVRNNRVLGYFLPEREYEELKSAAQRVAKHESPRLSQQQEDTLVLYSQGKVASSEVKVELQCDRRQLMALLADRDLKLPHMELSRAEGMANELLEALGMGPGHAGQPQPESAPHG